MCESETHQRKRQGEQETVGKAVDAQDDLAVPGTPCAKRGHEQPHDNGREDEVGQAQFLGNQVCGEDKQADSPGKSAENEIAERRKPRIRWLAEGFRQRAQADFSEELDACLEKQFADDFKEEFER